MKKIVEFETVFHFYPNPNQERDQENVIVCTLTVE